MFDSLWFRGLEPARLLCALDFPGKNTGVLVEIFFFSGFSQPRDQTQVSSIVSRFFTTEEPTKQESFLIRVKEESEKTGFKLNIQKTKIMASSLIISWQIEEEKLEAVTDFIFLAPIQMVSAAMKLKDNHSLEEKLWKT